MKTRKLLAIILSLSMIVLLATACKSGGTTTSSKSTGLAPMTISIATWSIGTAIPANSNDAVLQTLYKKFNITIKPVNVSWDDYRTKISVWAASGSLPDLFSIDQAGTSTFRDWATQGVIHALPSDLSSYPYLKTDLSSPDIQALKINGSLYCIPRGTYNTVGDWELDRAVLYRWDWAQQLGVTAEPTTWADFTAMLKKFSTSDPENKGSDRIGLTSYNTTYLETLLLPFSPDVADDGSGVNANWIKEDGKWIPALFSKDTLPGVKAIKALYDDGILDKDFAVLKGTEGIDKFTSGQAGAVVYGAQTAFLTTLELNWEKTYPNKDFTQCVKVWHVPADSDGTAYHFTNTTYWSEAYINASASSDKVARILSLANYMLSPDGKNLVNYGIKGVDYTEDSNGNITQLTDYADLLKKYPSMNAIPTLFNWNQDKATALSNPTYPADIRVMSKADYAWYDANTKDTPIDFTVRALSTPAKDKLVIDTTGNDITQLILSKDIDAAWATMVANYNKQGLQTAETEVTAAEAKLGK
jgi:putative aldouronate transport system substrate-binding protein